MSLYALADYGFDTTYEYKSIPECQNATYNDTLNEVFNPTQIESFIKDTDYDVPLKTVIGIEPPAKKAPSTPSCDETTQEPQEEDVTEEPVEEPNEEIEEPVETEESAE